ncbi:intercellular adhesion molecule 3 isoform X1 [Elephas maximus indicus]|uniref:intercellular adhesion molecule 3 isoform X1 n=1 Tax=Elephas maximus indicus TaxID=99487 RepID=UPI002116E681|nr:intercellular adhesion molecule 3 isoform X1 [Elephas maximus indicus]
MVPLAPLLQACLSLLILLLLVCCLLPPGAQGQVSPLRVEPQNPVVPTGGSLLVNCSADCPDPENIILETALSKQPVGSGLSWSAFQLSNVTGDSDIICAGFCNGSQISGSTSITVYRPGKVSNNTGNNNDTNDNSKHTGLPERMDLAPLPPWQPVGENFTLHCQVWGGAPRANLSMVLFRGQEELGRQPAVGEPAEVTATMPARREDYGANFSCSTQLDLRPQGLGLLENSSTSRQLRTFALPMTRPFLTAPRILEVGKETAVNCSLDGVFPVWEAQVHMTLGDQMLNSTVVSHGDALRATAMATAREEQKGAQIVCKVTLAGESRETWKNVTIYSFVEPILNLSEASASEGTMVTVTCMAGTRVQVMLGGAPIMAPGQPAQLQLNATESDNGRNFSCNATLEVDGKVLHKNRSVQLNVLYGPKIDRTKCPQRLMWKDKTYQVLQCQARGNPDPMLQCLQEGSRIKVPVGIPFFVRLYHNGTYHCQAISPRGITTVEVVMEVQDRNARSVTIAMVVLLVLSLVIVTAALLYVFGVQRRRGSYCVKHESTSLPLTSTQPDGLPGEEPS